MPTRVCHDGRQDDGAHTFRDHESKQKLQSWNCDRQYQQLTKLDPEIERQERRQKMRSRKLKSLFERERESEPVDDAETERDSPSAAKRHRDDVFERHVDN